MDYADNWAQRTRWLRVFNERSDQIPAFAVMRVQGHFASPGEVGTNSGQVRQGQQIWRVNIPVAINLEDHHDAYLHLINGPQPIPPLSYGRASMDWPAQALYTPSDTGTVYSTIGIEELSWSLAFNGGVAYGVLGRDVTGPSSGDGQRLWVTPAIRQLVGGASHVNVTGANQSGTVTTTPVKITWAGQPLHNRGGHTLGSQSITVGTGGVYEVHFHCAAKSDNGEDQITYTVYLNDQATHIASFRVQEHSTGSSSVSFIVHGHDNIHISGLLELAAGDVLDVRVQIDAGSSTVITSVPAFWINRLGAVITP